MFKQLMQDGTSLAKSSRLATAFHWVSFFAILLILMAGAQFFVRSIPYVSDEYCHFWLNIRTLIEGSWKREECLTTFLGYHFATATLMSFLGLKDINEARALNGFWGIASALLALAYFKDSGWTVRWLRALQIFTFLLLISYYFVVYTDVFSSLLVMAAFASFEIGARQASGILQLFAVLTRQTQIIWSVFLVLLQCLRHKAVTFKALLKVLKETWVSIFVIAAFGIWVLFSGSLAVGDKNMHPSFKLQLGNVWFFCIGSNPVFSAFARPPP